MHILHLALGGCLRSAPVRYGVTEDTGGHIAYVLGAAMAQARLPQVASVDIVTRAFDAIDPVHAQLSEPVSERCRILRLQTPNRAYLSKEALEAELPALSDAFCAMLAATARRPDVIHAHFADAARLAAAAEARFGIPWVYTPHSLALQKGHDAAHRPELRDRIAAEQAAIAGAGAIILSSRDEAERQLSPYGAAAEGRSHCLAPGVTLLPDEGPGAAEALLAPFLRQLDLPIVLAVARPVDKKNLAGLVEAYGRSPELRARANLVILAGLRDGIESGPAEQVQVLRGLFDAVDRHGLWGQAALPARHDARQLRALYARAAEGGVFVNPALHEPFGLTLIEAAQAGVPVVGTRNGGPVDIIETLGHGALVDPEDPRDIAAACLRMLDDPAGAAEARARAVAAFDWTGWARRSIGIYGQLRRPAPQPRRGVRRILACDIDGTLTGCQQAAARFGEWHGARDADVLFAVATGRSVSEARRVLSHWALPRPDLFITSVGTEIWRWEAGDRLAPCRDYAAWLDAEWDRTGVQRVMAVREPVWQPAHEQRRWKLSLFGTAEDARALDRDLHRAGLAARVIASHERFIDVLPQAAGKAAALRFEASRRGLDLADCIAAGDSGNDADMLEASGASILPANAYAELAHLRGEGIYLSPFAHAAGVIDGLERLGLARQDPRRRVRARQVATGATRQARNA